MINRKRLIKFFLSHPKLCIVALALLVRMLTFIPVALNSQRVVELGVDSYEYHFLAVNLAEAGAFSNADAPPYAPNARHVPLYPLFAAIIYSLFGQNFAVLAFAQTIISALSCLLLYEIGKIIFGKKAGLLAGVLMALHIGLIGYAPLYQTETLFIFILLVGVYYLAKYILKQRKNINLIFSGLLLGLAALCRSVGIYLPLVIVAILFFVKMDFLKKLKSSVIFLGCFLLVISTWTLRNYLAFKDFLFTPTAQFSLFFITATEIETELTNENFGEVLEKKINKYGLGPKDKYNRFVASDKEAVLVAKRKTFLSEALKIMRTNALATLKVYLRGRIYTCFFPLHGPMLGDIWGRSSGTGIFSKISNLPLRESIANIFKDKTNWPKLMIIVYGVAYMLGVYFGAGLSLVKVKTKSLSFFLLLAIAIYFPLISFVGPKRVYPRYRLPMMPFVLLLAAKAFLAKEGSIDDCEKEPI